MRRIGALGYIRLQATPPATILRHMEAQMETEIATFDTHDFVKRLTSVGMPEAQAEILAWGQSRRNEHLADKRDIKGLEARTREIEVKIREVEVKIREVEVKIREIEAKIEAQAASIKALELAITKQEAAIKLMEVNFRRDLQELKIGLTRDIKEMEHKLTIKLGAFMGIGITFLAALITLLNTAAP